ncbi:MAG: thiamine phosphate synthase [Pyrinomonadaceae bacterium]|nr:thiamine phosphate synthase [Pyrinomonadaceae bacterium]
MFLPKIYPITDTRLSKLSHAEQVEKLVAGGADFLQLREKHASPKEFYAEAEKALQIARKQGVKIVINDRVDIALALKADGVHLGQDDLPPEAARKILGENAIIGFSTHSIRQAVEAVKMPINYLAIGPIFATKTKENPDEIVGLDGLKQVREAIGDFPLVAIGGIDAANLPKVFANGADSCALISALVSSSGKISQMTQEFLNLSAKR